MVLSLPCSSVLSLNNVKPLEEAVEERCICLDVGMGRQLGLARHGEGGVRLRPSTRAG